MKNKIYRLSILAFALVMTMTVPTPVKAAKVSWEFKREAVGGYKELATANKADGEKNWYVTINKTKYTNLSGKNMFECKVVDKNDVDASNAFTFSSYGRKVKPYKTTAKVKKGYESTLKGKKTTSSTAAGKLILWGYFAP